MKFSCGDRLPPHEMVIKWMQIGEEIDFSVEGGKATTRADKFSVDELFQELSYMVDEMTDGKGFPRVSASEMKEGIADYHRSSSHC